MKKTLCVLSLLAAACSAPRRVEAPAETARAFAAFDALQKALGARLMERLKEGPAAAVAACKDDAPKLAASLGAERGFAFGRTSHRLRNPANAPRPWAAPYLKAAAGKPAAEVKPVTVDLGGTVGVLRPIGAQTLCLRCHGERAAFPPALSGRLGELYPKDAAVGFKEGELRGFFWAEVPKAR